LRIEGDDEGKWEVMGWAHSGMICVDYKTRFEMGQTLKRRLTLTHRRKEFTKLSKDMGIIE
jgi:hypothetical protein